MKKNHLLLLIVVLFTIACEKTPKNSNDEPENDIAQIYNKFVRVFIKENPGITQNDVNFFDAKNGVSVGDKGSVFTTSNSGYTWTQSSAPDSINIWQIYGIEQDYWFCSTKHLTKNRLYKIENNQWTNLMLPPMPENDFIESFCFIDKNIGYISTFRQHINSYNDLIFKTEDGGMTWDTVGFFGNAVTKMHMFDENNGIGASGTAILTTSDGWVNWENVGPQGLYSVYNYPYITGFATIDRQHIIAVGRASISWDKGFICTSSNGGTTWEYSLIEHSLNDIAVTNDKIYVCGEESYIAFWDIDLNNFSSENIIANMDNYICSYDNNSDFVSDPNGKEPWGEKVEFVKIQFTNDTNGFVYSNNYIYKIVLQ